MVVIKAIEGQSVNRTRHLQLVGTGVYLGDDEVVKVRVGEAHERDQNTVNADHAEREDRDPASQIIASVCLHRQT